MKPFEQDLAKFWSRVEIPTHAYWRTACWEWRGSETRAWSRFGGNGSGYGKMRYGERTVRAHRWILQMLLAPHELLDEEVVMHICDNRKCVNPNHLQVGTLSDNLKDTHRKGRR